MRRLVAGVAAVVVALTGCAGTAPDDAADDPSPGASAAPTDEPAVELDVEAFEDLSHEHVGGVVAYPQNPPVGGPHNARWLACDVYDEPVPAEAAVHSMEHGAVWITYRQDVDAAGAARLAELAELDTEYVLVSPFPEELPAPVVVSSWGVQLRVDGPDDPRLHAFVERHAGGDQGGEPGAPCRTDGLTPQQAREAVTGG